MIYLRRTFRILFTISVLIAGFFGADTRAEVADCRADETIRLLEKTYRDCGTLKFEFTRQTISTVFGNQPEQEGQALIESSGNRFWIKLGDEVFIRNDDTLWHYVPAYQQVTVRIVDTVDSQGWPTDFLWSLRKHFVPVDCEIDTLGKKPTLRVRAVAVSDDAAIQRLTVWIDPNSFFAIVAEYIDYNDDRVQVRFDRTQKVTEIRPERFQPNFPDSAEVVILPQKKHQQKTAPQR